MRLTRRVTQDDMSLYSRTGEPNIHDDLNVARRTGLRATVAQGMMTLAYASELLTREHGRGWLERGELSVKFIGLVYAGDEITVSADGTPDGYEVRAHNQDGDLVLIGTARLPAAPGDPGSS